MEDKKHLFFEYYFGRDDKYNYAIYERKVRKSGKLIGTEYFEVIGFHPRLSTLCKSVKEMYTKANMFNEDVEELINNLERLNKVIQGE